MKFDDHCDECLQKLGDRWASVNSRIDQFAHYPDHDFLAVHRNFMHHQEGVEYFGRLYGKGGRDAAILHIIADMGHVPAAHEMWNRVPGMGEYGRRKLNCTCSWCSDKAVKARYSVIDPTTPDVK